jgi:hypothetical protein
MISAVIFRILLAFVLLYGMFFLGFRTVRRTLGKPRWTLSQLSLQSAIYSILTIIVMLLVVFLS